MTPSLAAALAILALAGSTPEGPGMDLPGDTGAVRLTPIEASSLERVRAALPQRTQPALSRPLVEVARALARSAARGETRHLSTSDVRRALGEAGVLDPAPAAVLLSAPRASLPDALAAAARFRGATHLGLGVEVREGLAWAVLLATERRAEIDPFPRRVPVGGRLELRGTLLRLDSPRVWVSAPSGVAREVPVEADGPRFSASVRLDEPGWWRAEVGGQGPRGATVAALLDVACGEFLESAVPLPRRPEPGPADPEAAVARIRAEVDALRARQGLPPLEPDPALDREARLHSQVMLRAATLAHRVNGGPDLLDRLAAAGVAYRSARENVARGDGALDAHQATAESPGHLANLLDPGSRRMGVGIARGSLPGGQPVVYLTEILVEPRD